MVNEWFAVWFRFAVDSGGILMVHFSVVDCKLRNNCAIKMTGRPRLETSNMRDVRETFDIKKEQK